MGIPTESHPPVMNEHHDVPAQESTRPNKSALKRTHQALQKLVAELV